MPPHLRDKLRSISNLSRHAIQALDAIVWTVNPRHDTLAGVIEYLSQYTREYLQPSGLAVRQEAPTEIANVLITSDVRHELFLAVKEALQNVAKHSGGSEVRFEARVEKGALHLLISDNGRGLSVAAHEAGDGLHNMRERMKLAGGGLDVESQPNRGTCVTFRLPLRDADPLFTE